MHSLTTVREFDVSDDDIESTCDRIADWLESTGGLRLPVV